MKFKNPNGFLFPLFVLFTSFTALIPMAAFRIERHIWSWEGFFSSLSKQEWSYFLKAVLLFSILFLLITHLSVLIWGILSFTRCSLRAKLVLSQKTVPLIYLNSTKQKLELTLGKRRSAFCLWKKSGKVKWMLLFLAAAAALAAFPRSIPLTARWFEKYSLVAHAGGTSPSGNTYSNSLEAFESNYQQGHRVFEGDLCLTADGILVLEHDWEHWHRKMDREYTGQPVTYKEFMETKPYGTDTPMDLPSLIDFMAIHTDMYFMTDFKNCYLENEVVSGFRQIVQAAKDAGRMDVLDRFIIQNHNNDFKHWVDGIYPFQNWLYTYYSIAVPEEGIPQNLIAYCESENIPVITMWDSMPSPGWFALTQPRNMRIFAHTVNDIAYAEALFSMGVSGIYTDDIKPNQLASA